MLDQSKLQRLADLIETGRLIALVLDKVDCESNRTNCKVRIVPGRKYTKIDVGYSGAYMVDNGTGEIFGVKAYGVIHRGHRYGTLDTVDQWNWRPYQAIPRTA